MKKYTVNEVNKILEDENICERIVQQLDVFMPEIEGTMKQSASKSPDERFEVLVNQLQNGFGNFLQAEIMPDADFGSLCDVSRFLTRQFLTTMMEKFGAQQNTQTLPNQHISAK